MMCVLSRSIWKCVFIFNSDYLGFYFFIMGFINLGNVFLVVVCQVFEDVCDKSVFVVIVRVLVVVFNYRFFFVVKDRNSVISLVKDEIVLKRWRFF